MVSITLSVFVAIITMSTFSAVEAGKCNLDKAEMDTKSKQFNNCYVKITGQQPPKDKVAMTKIDKTVLNDAFVCMGQEDGTIEADGKTVNMEKAKELIQNFNQSDEVKAAFTKGTEKCYNAYVEKGDLDKFFKCTQMLVMEVCM